MPKIVDDVVNIDVGQRSFKIAPILLSRKIAFNGINYVSVFAFHVFLELQGSLKEFRAIGRSRCQYRGAWSDASDVYFSFLAFLFFDDFLELDGGEHRGHLQRIVVFPEFGNRVAEIVVVCREPGEFGKDGWDCGVGF